MRSSQTSVTFPLSAVKPLDRLQDYREACLHATRRVLAGGSVRRQTCPVEGNALTRFGMVGDLPYGRCPSCQSMFLEDVATPARWSALIEEVARRRQAPEGFHAGLAQSRADTVYAPKLEWIQETLHLQHLVGPRMLEVAGGPNPFTELLRDSRLGGAVATESIGAVAAESVGGSEPVNAVLLLEALDQADDPVKLLRAVQRRLVNGGLVFVTALVSSGFDMVTLGARNLYLCPPDRTNCFSLKGLSSLLTQTGFRLLEVSTPGVLDVEIVHAHLRQDPSLPLSSFERQILEADEAARQAFQAFLQAQGLSSFARLVGRKG